MLCIFYGTETGYTESLAKRLVRLCDFYQILSSLNEIDSFDFSGSTQYDSVTFLVSTTGQGDIPRNMNIFWSQLMRNSVQPQAFKNMTFSIMCCGDSVYQKYNYIGFKLKRRLFQLNANLLYETNVDDKYSCEDKIQTWLKNIIVHYSNVKFFQYQTEKRMYLKETISNPIHLTANEKTNFVNVENTLLKIYGQEYFPVKVKSNVRQTNQCHWQDVRLLGLDVIHPYESGSTLFMIYNNDDELVSQFLNLWSLNRDDTILYPDINMILPWKFIAKYILDLNATPKDLYFWTLLNHFSMDELEKSKLTEFCNPSYEEELLEYCRRPKRTIMEILQDFKESIKSFKIEYIFQLIPRIKPREFSIASSAKMGNHLEILASIVSFKTTMKIQRKGACTAFLEKLENNDTVFISLTKTCQFPLYNSVLITKPLILVSTGVGCATFRGIIYDRYVDDRATYIFFGCRRRDLDFYFETFWKKVEQSKNIHIFYAFSRENEKKVYVQNLLLEKSSLLYDIIVKQNGAVFISGKAKQMPTEISNSILQIIKDFGNIKLEKAKQYLSYMEFKNKYQTKTWN